MHRAVGIDLGRARVKAVVLEHRRGGFVVAGSEVLDQRSGQSLADGLRRFLLRERALGAPIELCLSACSTSIRMLDFEDRPGLVRHVRRVARGELEDELARDLDDRVTDATVLERSEGLVSVLAVAVPESDVRRWIEVLATAGIEPAGVHPALGGLALALRSLARRGLPPSTLLVDLGAGAVRGICLRDGGPRYAVSFRHEINNDPIAGTTRAAVLRTAGAQLGLALTGRLLTPPTVLVTGGLAASRELRDGLSEGLRTGILFETLRELRPDDLGIVIEPELLPAVGSALHQWETRGPLLELRRGRLTDPQRRRRLRVSSLAATLALAAGLGLWGLTFQRASGRAEREIHRIDRALERLWAHHFEAPPPPPGHIAARLTSERIRLEGLAGQGGPLPESRDVLEVVHNAFEHLPAETRLYLSSLSVGQEAMTLEGEVATHATAERLAQALRTAPRLDPRPPTTSLLSHGAVHFETDVSYSGPEE